MMYDMVRPWVSWGPEPPWLSWVHSSRAAGPNSFSSMGWVQPWAPRGRVPPWPSWVHSFITERHTPHFIFMLVSTSGESSWTAVARPRGRLLFPMLHPAGSSGFAARACPRRGIVYVDTFRPPPPPWGGSGAKLSGAPFRRRESQAPPQHIHQSSPETRQVARLLLLLACGCGLDPEARMDFPCTQTLGKMRHCSS